MKYLFKKDDVIIIVNNKIYSGKELTLDWFRMSNDAFYDKYLFNFNLHEFPMLYKYGRKVLYGE